MSSIANIAGSALQAYATGQQVTAHNVANLNTDGFKASRSTFQENGAGGVNASVSKTNDPVDISQEAVTLLSHAAGFKANIKVFQAADDMMKDLFSIKA